MNVFGMTVARPRRRDPWDDTRIRNQVERILDKTRPFQPDADTIPVDSTIRLRALYTTTDLSGVHPVYPADGLDLFGSTQHWTSTKDFESHDEVRSEQYAGQVATLWFRHPQKVVSNMWVPNELVDTVAAGTTTIERHGQELPVNMMFPPAFAGAVRALSAGRTLDRTPAAGRTPYPDAVTVEGIAVTFLADGRPDDRVLWAVNIGTERILVPGYRSQSKLNDLADKAACEIATRTWAERKLSDGQTVKVPRQQRSYRREPDLLTI
jgi:hypothetical protein